MNKNLLALSVAAAALASSASAAVSSNIVGYVKLNLKKGLTLIANPLDNTSSATGNNISSLFAGIGDAEMYSWDGTSYVTSSFLAGTGLVTPDFSLAPGVAVFIEVPADVSVTFVGNALINTQTKAIQIGNNFVASKVPISGTVTELGITPSDADVVLKWENGGYVAYDYADGIGWPNGEPSLTVGQGMVYQTLTPFTWSKTFTVTP